MKTYAKPSEIIDLNKRTFCIKTSLSWKAVHNQVHSTLK